MRIAVLDIGGTAIKSGVWDGEKLIDLKETATEAAKGGEAVMQNALNILHTYGSFDAVGVSTAGQVNTETGSIHYANENIPGYTGMKIVERIENEFHVPAAAENDVNAAALGEAYYGAGRDFNNFICLTYGTGVGGAIVMDKQIYAGSSFSAGYFGGVVVHPEEMNTSAELSGCYEKYASTTALVRKMSEVDAGLNNGRAIFEAFDRPEVKAVIDWWIDEITYGLVTLIHTLNPSAVLLGGGIMAQPYVTEEVRKRTLAKISKGFGDIQIIPAALSNTAGLMGALKVALNKM